MFGGPIPQLFGSVDAEEPGNTSFSSIGAATAAFTASAVAGAVFGSAGAGAAAFDGLGVGPISAVLSAEGAAKMVGVSSATASAVLTAAGSSAAAFTSGRRFVARCAGAFTYEPLPVPEWEGTIRRDPEIVVRVATNDSPSSMTFVEEEDPELGSDVQLDMNDGHGVIGAGVVQAKTMNYDGRIDALSYETIVADYLWLLNKRRPFGCFENVSASVVAQSLLDDFAPADFSGAGIVPGLPAITVSFDGTLDFSGCMSLVANAIAGRFRVKDKVLSLFITDPVSGPAVIDDSNMLLLRDQPLSVRSDISQLRNRVFVRGAAAHLLADTAAGDTTLQVDGIDVFDAAGGEGIIGCDRFTYTGVDRTLIYPTPESSLQQPGSTPEAASGLGTIGIEEAGPIRTTVRYSTSFVIDGRESLRTIGSTVDLNMLQGQGMTGAPTNDALGLVPSGNRTWWVGIRATDGTINWQQPASSTSGPGGRYTFNIVASYVSNDLRPAELVLWRLATIGDVTDYFETAAVPYVSGTISYVMHDVKADASLGNRRPDVPPADVITSVIYSGIGHRVFIYTPSLSLAQAAFIGASRVNLYREENYYGGQFFTPPELVLSFAPTDTPPAYLEDVKTTRVLFYQGGDPPPGPDAGPPPAPPTERLVLRGVSGLDEAHKTGDEVACFIQRDDLASQLAMAQAEGGDGLHEYFVVDTTLRGNAALAQRGDAELELFAWPIVEARYSSFDPNHEPGGTVEFNLTNPPFVASLKITEVAIDKVHYSHGHVARYNVTASSVKFTLQDLLRRTILRP